MKNVKDYVIRGILKLKASHSGLSAKYGFDNLSQVHFVEIGPGDKINDVVIKEALAEMMFSFYGAFPEESIVFLSHSERIKARYPYMVPVIAKNSGATTRPAIH